jgi:hypothetical protein
MSKWIVLALSLWLCAFQSLSHAEGRFIARVGPSGEFLELEDQTNGQAITEYIPVHQASGVRYFSAGVGLEERQAAYPPFALKLVFAAGGRPYVTGVEVTIKPVETEMTISIPREQVDGPWLFIDLASGTYDISATYRGNKQALKRIKVVGGKQQTVLLRWEQDTGPTTKVPRQ